ncbi:hypothetical protein ES703_85935 [subsurface metagenome]
MGQLFLLAYGADEGCEEVGVLLVPVHGDVEVCLHLEQLVELPVPRVEDLVDLGVPDQYHLAVERYGLRRDRLGHYDSEPSGGLLYLQLLVRDRPLQALVDNGIGEQPFDR